MLDHNKLYKIGFYEFGIPFTGSIGGLHGMQYRLARNPLEKVRWKKKEEREGEMLLAECWQGPMNYSKTNQENIIKKEFEFSEDGKIAAAKWIEQQAENWKQ